MSRTEIGHCTMAVLSFVPVLFYTAMGKVWVFIITSALAALLEVPFVLQRYNRHRAIRLMER